MKIFLISLTIGFQQGNSHCVPSSAPWEMVKWPFTIASLSFMLPTMRALVNILGFYWIYLSDTPQTVTYASKEAAKSPFYDYLSVYRRDLLAWCVGYKVYVNFVQLYLD